MSSEEPTDTEPDDSTESPVTSPIDMTETTNERIKEYLNENGDDLSTEQLRSMRESEVAGAQRKGALGYIDEYLDERSDIPTVTIDEDERETDDATSEVADTDGSVRPTEVTPSAGGSLSATNTVGQDALEAADARTASGPSAVSVSTATSERNAPRDVAADADVDADSVSVDPAADDDDAPAYIAVRAVQGQTRVSNQLAGGVFFDDPTSIKTVPYTRRIEIAIETGDLVAVDAADGPDDN